MYLLFDIGGTNMRVGISRNGDRIDCNKTVGTVPLFGDGVKTLVNLARELSEGERIKAAAGGIAGPLDKHKTLMLSSPHISGWINKPFKNELEKKLNAEVFLENDAAIAGLGEAVFGAGKGKEIVAYITVSTGLGGTRIVRGKIDKSAAGFEPGHQIIDFDGSLSGLNGRPATLENLVSGSGLERRFGKKAYEITDPEIWEETAKLLAVGLTNSIVHWSPEVVVTGGSVMNSLSIDRVRFYLKEYLKIFRQPPDIVPAQLKDMAGLYGALAFLNMLH